jgi:hypothetical protein
VSSKSSASDRLESSLAVCIALYTHTLTDHALHRTLARAGDDCRAIEKAFHMDPGSLDTINQDYENKNHLLTPSWKGCNNIVQGQLICLTISCYSFEGCTR